jgi:fructose-1,6-bisphosphatase/inositol monophosphatase family enzyme
MNYNKPFNFLKNLPKKLNNFYIKNSKYILKINNKSKNKKKFDPVTNLDKAFEKFIRHSIIKQFPKDAILGEEFLEKYSNNNYKWYVDPIDGTKAFMVGAPTWSNLVGFTSKNQSVLGLANFPALNKYYINDQKKSYLIGNKKTI